MDTTNADSGPPSRPLMDDAERVDWEAERIAEADAEIAAGLYVDDGDMRAWVDSLRTQAPLEAPPTRRR